MRRSLELHGDSKQRLCRRGGLLNQFLNSLAVHPSHYWIGFVTDPVTVVLFIFWDTSILHRSIYASIGCYTGGMLTVSLCEYALHRWIFHSDRVLANTGHLMHHESPDVLLAVPWFVTAGLWWSIAYIAVNQLRIPFVPSVTAGFVTGYTVYGTVHHILHHHNLGSRRFRKLRIHHRIHHRFPDVNFGITSRLWDKVFGTMWRRSAMAKDSSGSHRMSPT